MSVLVYAEAHDGAFNKKAFEVVTYARKTADILDTECIAATVNADQPEKLGLYGAHKVIQLVSGALEGFDSGTYSQALAAAADQVGADTIILQHSADGKSILGRLAAKLGCGSVSAVNQLPTVDDGFQVEKPVFSGKAFAKYSISSEKRVLSLVGNSIPPEELGNEDVEVEEMKLDLEMPKVKVVKIDKVTGKIPLPEAELVVSAGRGMKGPENWGIIEELAEEMGATTACSRPVADSDWRPHHEHVGQTGIAIRPNLYIAIGISGAIQHLAGVNNSDTIVVINKDPEAPFFKAADYGVVADLFDVVPRLTEAIKKYKAS
jgi:electron transfer flavoprotein alpha subunit